MVNPLDFKHRIAGQPYRLSRKLTGPKIENDPEFLTALMGAGYTAALNIAAPLTLIQSGTKGTRYFTHLSIGYSHLGYPMPRFNYITPASKATKLGAKIGGKVGLTKIGGRIAGRLVPGLGWGLLAYDAYDVVVNRSLWGFDLG